MLLLLLKNWQFIVIGLLLAALAASGVYINLIKAQKATLTAEKATVTTMLTESQGNLLQLQNDIKTQNLAIDKLKSEADTRVASHAADIKKAQDVAANYKAQAASLANRPAPQNMNRCDAANSLFTEELKNAKK